MDSLFQAGVQGTSSMWGHGINMYQFNQEKKRQQRLDNYNKELNAQQYRTSLMQNSPSYQLARARQAGFNPLAQGMQPIQQPVNAGSPVVGQQMPIGAVGDSAANVGQSIGEAIEAIRNYRLAKEQLKLNQKKTEAEIRGVDNDIELKNAQLVHSMVVDGKLSMEEGNELMRKRGIGYEIKGKSLDLQKKQADIDKVIAETTEKRIGNEWIDAINEANVEATLTRSEQMKVETRLKRLEHTINKYHLDVERLGLNDNIPWAIKFPLRLLLSDDKSRKEVLRYLRSKPNAQRYIKIFEGAEEMIGEGGKQAQQGYVILLRLLDKYFHTHEEDAFSPWSGKGGKF